MVKIAIFDVISLMAGIAALVILVTSGKRMIRRDVRWLMIGLVLSVVVYNGFMCIEWLGINHTLDSFEDMTGALLPMMWAFVFYAHIQQMTNKELHNSTENLRITLNSIGDAVIATTVQGRITRMNPVAEELTGWKFDDAKGRKLEEVFNIIDNDTRLKLKNPVGYVIETGEKIRLGNHTLLVSKDNKEYNITDSAAPIFTGTSEIIGVVLVFSDVTAKYNQAQRLHDSEERLNLALSGTKAGLWDWHIPTGKAVFNDLWANMLGYELKELEPLSIKTWERLTQPEDLIKSEELLELHYNGKTEIFECEIRMKHKAGHWVWILDRGMVVERNKTGSPVRMAGTHIDISRLKKVELELTVRNEELREAREKAEESDRLKSAFLANMSHEIRTPMNGIIGFSEMIRNPDLSAENRKNYAEIIVDSSRQLLTIVNDILDISRIETGKVPLHKEPVAINDLISILYAFFEPQTTAKHVTLQTTKDLNNSECTIFTDKTRLRQVLTNLLNNALKFTCEGYIHFGYRLKDEMLEFFVEVTGIGVPEEMHEKIFEPFRQVELEMTSQYGGTGLGLSISRKLVELLGGTIWMESHPDHGSVFSFTIPYNRVPVSDIELAIPDTNAGMNASGMVLLIAEDDDVNYLYLQTLLSKYNFRLIRAGNGLEAKELCDKTPDIKLVLMDIKMPYMNGYDATLKIKRSRPDLPVIVQSAYAMNEDKAKAFAAGCDDYLTKPIRKEELMAMVEKYCKV